jgi:hypothetical protein
MLQSKRPKAKSVLAHANYVLKLRANPGVHGFMRDYDCCLCQHCAGAWLGFKLFISMLENYS